MTTAKFDAALSVHLLRQQPGDVRVSVRLRAPLTPDAVLQLQALGLPDAGTGRRVLFGALPADALARLAKLDEVVQLSLVQASAPNASHS